MEAGFDNANNPFAIPNGGSNTDNILSQKTDSLLLNLTDKYKQNGSDVSLSTDFPLGAEEKSKNGSSKRNASSIFDDEDPEDDNDDEDDFGPETNVDALSPLLETSKGFFAYGNNNPNTLEEVGVLNPFVEHQEKAAAAVQMEHGLQKMWERQEEEQQQHQEEDEQKQDLQEEQAEQERQRMARDETPTPPADTVHDVSGLVENAAESDSEDEWNYIKGEEANKENIEPQPSEKEVAEIPEEDNMSQLNPNAAEFVPVSPTRSIPSPACRMIMNDEIISHSPKRPLNVDINLPNPKDFEKEVKSRPSEVDSFSNGHKSDDELPTSPTQMMENLLNGKNIDEIPEFQPGSTPQKTKHSEEFHFGPNAAPFTPVKLLDQSEALSTRAVFGDESTVTLGMSLNESTPQIDILNKESDPMSMSFYAEKDDVNPFDLNQVQMLPENIDDFLKQPEEVSKVDILDEQNKLSENFTLNNHDAIQTTDLDKQSYDDEKELASPPEPEKELPESEDLLSGREECDRAAKTPKPMYENLIDSEFCKIGEKSKSPQPDTLSSEVELISPKLKAGSATENFVEQKSPLLQATEVSDLLQVEDVNIPRDVEVIAPELLAKLSHNSNPEDNVAHQVDLLEPAKASEIDDKMIEEESKMSASELPVSTSPICEIKSSVGELEKPSSPICELTESTHAPVLDLQPPCSPVCETFVTSENELPPTESSGHEFPESKSDVCELQVSKSPVCEFQASKSPVSDILASESATCDLQTSKSPICDSPVCDIQESKSPVCDFSEKSSVGDDFESKSPIPQENICNLAHNDDSFSISPIPTQATCDFTKPELIQQAEQNFEELCKPLQEDCVVESPQEEVTSSLKDDISPPAISPFDSPADQLVLNHQEVEDRVQMPASEILQRQAQEPESCPVFSPKSTADTESIVTDVTSFLERSLPPEVASPLSPPEQEVIESSFSIVNEQHKELQQSSEQIDVKTENISREFAEQTIVTPSEESKQEDICVGPPLEEPVKEHMEEKPQNENVLEEVATVTAVAAAGAAVATVVAATPSPKKTDDKKKTTSAKKPTTPKSTSLTGKPTSKAAPATKTTSSRLNTAAKTATLKPGTTTKSATEISSTKTTQVKTAATKPKPNITRTTTRPTASTTTSTKLSPGKTSAPKPAPTPRTNAPPKPAPITRPATAPKTSASRSTTTTSSLAAKSKPNSTSRVTPTKPPSATLKPSVTKTSPRTMSAPTAAAPKPRVPSTITAKQRVPLAKTTAGKAPDTVKQSKESANKLTASKNLTGTIGSSITRTTTTRKVESKPLASRTTVSKSTTTTMKSTTSKKPTEIIRNKTKTTKIEKPNKNGVSTVVTEEITIVNTTNTVIDNEPLLKDNSPLDNKLLIEENNTLIDTNVAD